jgi:hypothetical protein
MTDWETVWTFYTHHYAVRLAVTDETEDPSGSFDRPEDVEFARDGGWHWFVARVQVVYRDTANPSHWADTRELVLGEDYLGGCSYHSLKDFRRDGYFRDMVREATREARETLARMGASLNTEGV